jgi:hypothetical protein
LISITTIIDRTIAIVYSPSHLYYLKLTCKLVTEVPDTADVVIHTKLPAVIVPLLKEVVDNPVVVLVTVIPEVTTSVPAPLKSEPYRIENVTDGVPVPATIDLISDSVNAYRQ